jgi:ferredoxin--NADP+ reductase
VAKAIRPIIAAYYARADAPGGAPAYLEGVTDTAPPCATIRQRLDLTDSLALFRFELAGGIPDYEPGQYLTLGLPHPDKPGKVLWRPYSIASPPERKDLLELYIRWARSPVPGKFTSLLWPLQVGAILSYKDPKGAFTIERLRPDGQPESRRMVLMGGGTGIAPFMAFVQHLKKHGTNRQIVLCHGASYVHELGYREQLQELERESIACGRKGWDFHYLSSISRPDDPQNKGWQGARGRVECLVDGGAAGGMSPAEEKVGERFTPENTTFYICGFDGTVQSVKAFVESRDFRTKKEARPDGGYDIKFESYG